MTKNTKASEKNILTHQMNTNSVDFDKFQEKLLSKSKDI